MLYSPDRNMSTVNREYFDVKIFRTAWLVRKLNARNTCMRNINDNAVQGRLSENYLTRKLSHEIF